MRVRWTTDAASDLERITERIAKDRPDAAIRTARTIYQGLAVLRDFPNRGRIGRIEGTRELVFPPLPYIAVYRVKSEAVEVLRIYHTAQDWP
jgi:toxin ParE1/3/4